MKKLYLIALIIPYLAACTKHTDIPVIAPHPTYNILILGNSITYTPANASIAWNGSWGMAASVADSDYVHLLSSRFKADNKYAVLTAVNIVPFELNFDTYDFAANLKKYKDLKPDFLIMRIGENVTTTDSVGFEKRYVDLLNYFKSNNPNIKILAAGSVWPDRDLANKVMSKHSDYISLISLSNDLSNFAFGLFTDPGIQSHPDNKGMRSISDQIWAAAQKE